MKRIENPLKEGMQAKIYYKAYPETISRYQIAKEFYNIKKGQIPPTAKISIAAKELIKSGHVTEIKNKGILSNAASLLAEIEKEMKEKKLPILSESEKKELFDFLDTDFRKYVKEPIPKGAFNAYENMAKTFGCIVYIKNLFNSMPHKRQKAILLSLLENKTDSLITPKEINNVKLSSGLLDKLAFLEPPLFQQIKRLLLNGFMVGGYNLKIE